MPRTGGYSPRRPTLRPQVVPPLPIAGATGIRRYVPTRLASTAPRPNREPSAPQPAARRDPRQVLVTSYGPRRNGRGGGGFSPRPRNAPPLSAPNEDPQAGTLACPRSGGALVAGGARRRPRARPRQATPPQLQRGRLGDVERRHDPEGPPHERQDAFGRAH